MNYSQLVSALRADMRVWLRGKSFPMRPRELARAGDELLNYLNKTAEKRQAGWFHALTVFTAALHEAYTSAQHPEAQAQIGSLISRMWKWAYSTIEGQYTGNASFATASEVGDHQVKAWQEARRRGKFSDSDLKSASDSVLMSSMRT